MQSGKLLFFLAAVVALVSVCGAAQSGKQTRPPRPQKLSSGIEWTRDAKTGELRYKRAVSEPSSEPGNVPDAAPVLRVGVSLVQVNCTVLAADGLHARGLSRESFRIFEDGVEQSIAHFDAAHEPARIALLFDASPSVYRELREMKLAAQTLSSLLAPVDEIAVASFSADTFLLLPFSRDRAQLDRAISSADGVHVGSGRRGSNVYEAVYLLTQEIFRGRRGRKAIILLTDGQDSGLGLRWPPVYDAGTNSSANRLTYEDVVRALGAAGVDLFVVSTQPRPLKMTDDWLAAHASESLLTDANYKQGMPHYTLYLAELVRRAGGKLYFLRELESLAEAYRRIAETLRAQYTLGFYSSRDAAQAGWRSLRVEVAAPPGARALHRAAYYIPAQ